MADFFKGLGNGMLSLVGLGQFYDPLGDAQSDLSSAKETLQTNFTTSMQAFYSQQTQINSDLWTYIQTNNTTIQDSINLYTTLTNNKINQINFSLLLAFIFISTFITLFFIKDRRKNYM